MCPPPNYRSSGAPENATALLQVANFATNLSISSSYNKPVKIRNVTACHLQTCYGLVETTCSIKPVDCFDNRSTCNKSVDNLQQTCRSRLNNMSNKIAATCNQI